MLLRQVGEQPHAAKELFEAVYADLRRIADARMKQERSDHTLQATALVHEAYVRLVGGAPVEYAYPRQGYIVWMDNVVLLKDAPNRENAIKFMDFLLEPENIAAVSNFAQYSAGVKGVVPLLDEALKTSPEQNPPADAPAGTFVQVCDEATQKVYDQIWTRLKK